MNWKSHLFIKEFEKFWRTPIGISEGSSFILPWKYIVEAWYKAVFRAVEPFSRLGGMTNHPTELNDSRKLQLRL